MANKDTSKAIVDTLQIDNKGLKTVKSINIQELMSLGVSDVSAFLQGLLDAENNSEFNDSSEDYVKGYKYGETGTF
jgi:hypothetical protein